MASKSPLQKLQDTLVEAVKGAITHPRDTAAKAGEQAKGTISLGKAVAGQVTKSAAGVLASRLPGHRSPISTPGRKPAVEVPRTRAETAPEAPTAKQPTPTKPPVTDVATDLVKQQAANRAAPKPAAPPVSPIDAGADAAHVEATPADLAKKATTAQQASATRTTVKKAPAKKAAAKKASTPSDRLPARKRVPAPGTDKD